MLSAQLQSRYVGFAGFLRANGYAHADAATALQALAHSSQLDVRLVRWTLRAVLCGRPQEWRRFDALFDAWFLPDGQRKRTEIRASGGGRLDTRQAGALLDDSPGLPRDTADRREQDAAGGAGSESASPHSALKQTDFRYLHDPESLRALDALLQDFVKRLQRIELRRDRPSQQGQRLDLARSLRRSVAHGGLPFELAWRQRRRQRPRLILLLDVSRSMNLYSFFYLRLARALMAMLPDLHCFIFHTRLAGIGQALRDPDPVRAQESLHLLSSGWGGGTRIGAALAQFNQDYAAKLLHARSCVLIASDGYDTGPADQTASALGALRRRARSVVWLNPLASRPDYTPTSACMQAALPLIDRLIPAGDLASLEKALPDILRACR